jgi:hypothetical protein
MKIFMPTISMSESLIWATKARWQGVHICICAASIIALECSTRIRLSGDGFGGIDLGWIAIV